MRCTLRYVSPEPYYDPCLVGPELLWCIATDSFVPRKFPNWTGTECRKFGGLQRALTSRTSDTQPRFYTTKQHNACYKMTSRKDKANDVHALGSKRIDTELTWKIGSVIRSATRRSAYAMASVCPCEAFAAEHMSCNKQPQHRLRHRRTKMPAACFAEDFCSVSVFICLLLQSTELRGSAKTRSHLHVASDARVECRPAAAIKMVKCTTRCFAPLRVEL